jgi:hypothetical protein
MHRLAHRVAGILLVLAACDVDCAGPSCNANVDVNVPPTKGPARTDVRAGSADPQACPGPAHSGLTSCFPGECSVGHWCDDVADATCKPGCVSDENCGPRDICVREGDAAIGRCESCGTLTAHEPKAGCVVPSRTGTTKCFPDCPAGQHCVDTGTQHCEPGCASDENCGPSEHCARAAGAALGVCRSCFFD